MAMSGYMQMAVSNCLSVISLSSIPMPSELLSMKAIKDIGRQSASFFDGPWKHRALIFTRGIFTRAVTSRLPSKGLKPANAWRSGAPGRMRPKVRSSTGSAFSASMSPVSISPMLPAT